MDKHFCSLFGKEEDALASHEGEALPSPSVSEEGARLPRLRSPARGRRGPGFLLPTPPAANRLRKKARGSPTRGRGCPAGAAGGCCHPVGAGRRASPGGGAPGTGERPGGAGTEHRARRGGGSVPPLGALPASSALSPRTGPWGALAAGRGEGLRVSPAGLGAPVEFP